LKETTTSAVDREKAGKMFELNEKYKDFPERVSEYEIDGKKYIVHRRFVGEKNIDEVIGRLAFERAMKEELKNRVIYVSIKDKDSIKVIE